MKTVSKEGLAIVVVKFADSLMFTVSREKPIKAGVIMNGSEIWSNIKRELLLMKWLGVLPDSWPPTPLPPKKRALGC